MRKILITALTAAICAAPASAQESTAKAPKPRVVKVERAGPRVLREVITTSGSTAAVKRSRLNFEVSGTVSDVLVEMGERVKAGQPLARLDDTRLKLYVEQARASFEAASASLDKLKSGFRPEEIAQAEAGVEAASAALAKFTSGFRTEEIKAAQAGLEAAQASFEQAQRNHERMKKLFEEKKAVAEATYEQARMQFEIARAQRDQAQQHLETLHSGYELQDIESMRARFKQAAEQLALLKKGFRQEDVKAAQAQVTVVNAGLKIAEKALKDSVLRAPYDGVIVNTYVDPGDAVSTMPGQLAVEIMDISSLDVIVPVADVWASTLTREAKAVADLDGGPKGLEVNLAAISDAIDPASRAFMVKLMLDNPGLKLKAGLFARVKIIYNEITGLAVASKAVQEDEAGKFVMLHENGLAVKTRVQTGVTSEGYTQITKGLAEGQPVIYEGNFGLRDRARVELSEDSDK